LKSPNYTLEEKFSYVEKYLCDFQLSLVPTRRPRYHQKLGDAWIPKVLVTIRKQTHHAILDLGSSVFVLSKVLVDDSNGYMVEFTSNACNYYERGGDKIPHYATNNYKLQGAAVNIHWKTSIHCYSFIYKMPMHRKEVRLCCYYFCILFFSLPGFNFSIIMISLRAPWDLGIMYGTLSKEEGHAKVQVPS
jgi:hypothetical protein